MFSKLYNEKVFNKKEKVIEYSKNEEKNLFEIKQKPNESDIYLSEIYKLKDWNEIHNKVQNLHEANEKANKEARNDILSYLESIKTTSDDEEDISSFNKFSNPENNIPLYKNLASKKTLISGMVESNKKNINKINLFSLSDIQPNKKNINKFEKIQTKKKVDYKNLNTSNMFIKNNQLKKTSILKASTKNNSKH